MRRPSHPGVVGIARSALLLAAMVIAPSLAGCSGWRFQAGLANAPGLNRPWTADDFAHGAIANGDESCPRSGRAEDDHLLHRWPPCFGR